MLQLTPWLKKLHTKTKGLGSDFEGNSFYKILDPKMNWKLEY